MSTESQAQGAAQTPTAPKAKLSEKASADALARMNRLKDQLATLRIDLPFMFANFSGMHDTPEATYQGFEQSALAITKQLAELKSTFSDPQTLKSFNDAKDSLNENPELDSLPASTTDDSDVDWEPADPVGDDGGSRTRES